MVFFCFTCGPHTFQSLLKGFENITVQCQNCGNFSGKIVKRWEWFTFCFIPVIPFSLKPDHDVHCHICRFNQDVKFRPDVQQQMDGGGGNIPMQNQGGQQGWGPQGPPHQYK
ncbi:hypothetical protein KC363_g2868 [Hortaea werneckii]|nr:hypothetical protein KC361_g7380 [Hortaea werneckii]KAI6885283.1 hypothetical protein KC325_g3679 [Hortaea werneckii]KAI6999532.1 hypothetical protein KC359_g1703 [Hortaea werneckii]KAI7146656.1 hypothetical protein KC344_g3459 [Hortaea werneckii]KAI7175278.1 hypothetical protein KC360_g3773 [Hortaea werneckii]